jgi:hypothetical protein
MSWKIGSHETIVSPSPSPAAALRRVQLPWRSRCRTMTPFGFPVDPDVYWRYARASGEMRVRGVRDGSSCNSSSAMTFSPVNPRASSLVRVSSTSVGSVSAAAARASRAMMATRSAWALLRGGYTGTAIVPA